MRGDQPTAGGRLQRALFFCCAGLLITITGLILYNVVMRYVFNAPPIWGEDVPRLLFVWLTFLGAGLATMLGINIRVTYFVDKMPERLRHWNEVVMHTLVLAMLAVIFRYSLPILELNLGGTMLSTGWSNAWFYAALPVGTLVMAAYQFVLFRRALLRALGRDTDEA